MDDVDFTPDGERAVGVLQDGTTQLWEVRTGRTLAVLAGHETYVWAVDVSRDGRLAPSYGRLAAGETAVVYRQLQVNPTNVGRRAQGVELRDGEELVTRSDRTVTILP